MGEAAVSFLLEQLKGVVTEYKEHISGAESDFDELKNELGMLKAFLKDAAMATKQEQLFKEMQKQIIEVIYEVEDTIDTCLSKAIEAKAKSKRHCLSKSTKSISLFREVNSIREEKVLPMFKRAKTMFSMMQIGDGSGAVDDQRTKLKRNVQDRDKMVGNFGEGGGSAGEGDDLE
ncbi:putative disease resistance protein At1g58400 [Salvia miltiorrhiza]|uniref:putative disease resistance protein At1g58400 n=1 Tax=Salvia miltiorrhiza TaxID=226208 RepID=UPI0025AD035C|nr:putative disease resistance protein At1g58400 [Salvia miltiorrhiza]